MRNKNEKNVKKTSVTKKKQSGQSHEFETMSQIQNRYGNGREKNGSDGGSTHGRGSNH